MEFLFLAGEVTLDFLNTRPVVDGESAEQLDSGHATLRWMRAAELITEHECQRAIRRLAADHRLPTLARALREAVRALVEAATGANRSTTRPLATFNRFLLAPQLRLQEGRFVMWRPYHPTDATQALAPIAAHAAGFLAGADLSLLRRCENPACVLFFYDTSRSHTRRWCNMQRCGNRMKVAEFRRRRR